MSSVIVTTAEELRAIVAEAVRSVAAPSPDEWMNADDVARMLGVKRSTIPALVSRESLPCYRPGKAYTFRRSEVEAWILERSNRPGSRRRPARGTLAALPGGKR